MGLIIIKDIRQAVYFNNQKTLHLTCELYCARNEVNAVMNNISVRVRDGFLNRGESEKAVDAET